MIADVVLGVKARGSRVWGPSVALSLALGGCISVDHAPKQAGGDGAAAGAGSGGAGAGGRSSGSGGRAPGGGSGGASSAGGKSGAGGRSGAGGAAGNGGASAGGADAGSLPPPSNTTPAADLLDVHVTGREGEDVTFTVSGTDAEGDVLFLSVEFRDASGKPTLVFDTHWDGVADSAADRLLFDRSLLGQPRFTGTVSLPGFVAKWPDAVQVAVHLEDAAGHASPDQTLPIGQQAVRKAGDGCDPVLVLDRCESGLSCGGDPAACQAGVAPDITDIGYFPSPDGPRLFVAGKDADDDVATLHLEFLSSTGSPVPVDVNGDQIVDGSTWDLDVYGASKGGAFFYVDQLGLGFDAKAPSLAVTPTDGAANAGARKTVKIGAPASRADGQPCDPRGFDSCPSLDVCAPGIAGDKSLCSTISSRRKGLCADAPVIDTGTNVLSAYGRAMGASVWDPPVGCAPTFAIDRPEGVVRLHLAGDAPHLTITTALPETRFDTVVYLLPSCDTAATAATACSDDDRGTSSTVTADGVKAGDYVIVVDSAHALGGSFGVSVSVK
jgi:hypothetical protein